MQIRAVFIAIILMASNSVTDAYGDNTKRKINFLTRSSHLYSFFDHNDISASAIISFAKSLLGVPYRYGKADPQKGFDCSGFVNYVFQQFNVNIPRNSQALSKAGTAIPIAQAKKGDLLIFTGTNANKRVPGHVGIITAKDGQQVRFIHASSGKAKSVTETNLEGSYQKRFMKVVRVMSDND